MDILSLGSPSFCHNAIVVSSVNSVKVSRPSVIGIGGLKNIFFFFAKAYKWAHKVVQTSNALKYGNHNLFNKSKRNCLVKHPTYDMNAVMMSVSPGRVVPCAMNLKCEEKSVTFHYYNSTGDHN